MPSSTPTPPIAKKQPTEFEIHGDVRIDNYFWMHDRENPDVIAYLEAENAYLESMMAHTEDLQEVLFEEIKGRIKEDDISVPYFQDGYWYYTRYEEQQAYPIFCRKADTLENEEEVMLDVNQLAEGYEYYSVGNRRVSSERNILAYAEDTQGRRVYTIRFKNLTTGELLDDKIVDVTSNITWANDNKTLFYTRQNLTTLRWDKIYRHEIGTDPSQDVLVYEENDETFDTYVFRTKSKKFLIIGSSQTLSDEYRYLDASTPKGSFTLIQERQRNLEYSISHFGDHLYIRTNHEAKNFRLMRTALETPSLSHWEEVIPHRADVFLEEVEIFDDFLVLSERKNGLLELRIRPWESPETEHYIDFGEPAYLAYIGINPQFDTQHLRYIYASMTTPYSTYEYDMHTRDRKLLKQQEVIGDFNRDQYKTERLYAPAQDGARVPISLVYHIDTPLEGTAPLMLYGYGSYGASLDAAFSSTRLSLLDRGFVYAIAHIRGGEELGRSWYEEGKLFHKKNTFTDFIDCAEFLAEQKYADPERIFAQGGSAGGLLMGAVMNMRPDLWRAVIAHVPFVDVMTTMLDKNIPLTTGEYDEWGNPNDKAFYDYMLSYSPYDNVEPQAYPTLLITTGLHDSQVQYWEPAKWAAKLRALKTDNNVLLLKTNMHAGHGGASGRYKQYREAALDYAFLIDQAKI